jgi:N-carbamoylputrescine amidase
MSKSNRVRIGLIQMSCGVDPAENLAKIVTRIGEAADAGAQIICTQELFRSRYFCQTEEHVNFELAEPIPGPSTAALCQLAAARGVVIVA